jgi:hypothetical protein
MANRMIFSAMLLTVGGLCIAVTVLAASWIDTTSVHESTALNQAALQAALQGKTIGEWTHHFRIVSPIVLAASFGVGGYLIVSGLVIGLRSISSRQIPS